MVKAAMAGRKLLWNRNAHPDLGGANHGTGGHIQLPFSE